MPPPTHTRNTKRKYYEGVVCQKIGKKKLWKKIGFLKKILNILSTNRKKSKDFRTMLIFLEKFKNLSILSKVVLNEEKKLKTM